MSGSYGQCISWTRRPDSDIPCCIVDTIACSSAPENISSGCGDGIVTVDLVSITRTPLSIVQCSEFSTEGIHTSTEYIHTTGHLRYTSTEKFYISKQGVPYVGSHRILRPYSIHRNPDSRCMYQPVAENEEERRRECEAGVEMFHRIGGCEIENMCSV